MSAVLARPRLLIAGIVVLLLAGGWWLWTAKPWVYKGPWEGTIVGKEYHPPSFVTFPGSCSGNPPVCSPPYTMPIPERYLICLRNDDIREPEHRYGCRRVDPMTYHAASFGDWHEFAREAS